MTESTEKHTGFLATYFDRDAVIKLARAAGIVEQAAETAERIRRAYPNVEVEVVEGGQAHYYYILGAE